MNRVNSYLVALLVAYCLLVPSVSAAVGEKSQGGNMPIAPAASAPQEVNAQFITMKRDIDKISSDLAGIRKDADTAIVYLTVAFSIVLAFSIFFYQKAVKRLRRKVSAMEAALVKSATAHMGGLFEEITNKKVSELDQRSTELLNKIEEKHFQYMQITSLRVSGSHDEALEMAGWSGDYLPFMNEPEAYQRILISCLAKSQNAQKDASHISAWQWSRVLLERTSTFRNMEAMLRTGIALKHFDEAVTEYDKHAHSLSPAERDKCEPILFVAIRRARKLANYDEYTIRLKELAIKHKNTADIKIATNFAAFYRDSGQLEDAERLMSYNVQRLTGVSPSEDGWERLFNTYIANCVDQGVPESATKQARTLIAASRRPDNVFTCARLAWFLDKTNPERDALFTAIESVMLKGNLPEYDDGTIKSKALLLHSRGNCLEAQAVLEAAIERAKLKSDKWSENNVYYYRSLQAQLLLDQRDAPSIQRAIEILGHDLANDSIGEAQYLMAKACALKGNDDGVFRHLESATRQKRKWIMVASYDSVLKDLPVVRELLMEHA